MSTILVVEDDADARRCLKDFLTFQGFHCLEADHGAAALAHLDGVSSITLIITDYQMPIMDGLHLLERLRHLEHWRDTPVILVSGNLPPAVAERAQAIGVQAIFQKPYDFSLLAKTIRTLVHLPEERT